MNNLYFLAYEASGENKTHRGYRIFELPDNYTYTEIAKAVEEKLDSIRSNLWADSIVATAFSMVK